MAYSCDANLLRLVVNLVYDAILTNPYPIQAFLSHKLANTLWTRVAAQTINCRCNSTLQFG